LLAIYKHTDYKYDIASNIQKVSQAIRLNYDSKIINRLNYIPKELKSLNQKQIRELNELGLSLRANPNIVKAKLAHHTYIDLNFFIKNNYFHNSNKIIN